MTNIKGFENINEIREMALLTESLCNYDFYEFNNERLPIININEWNGWVLPNFYIRAEIDHVRIKATFGVVEGGMEKHLNRDSGEESPVYRSFLRESNPTVEKLCGWIFREINISCENGELSAYQIKDLCSQLFNDVPNFSNICMSSSDTSQKFSGFGLSISRQEGVTYWNCYNIGDDFKDGERATFAGMDWKCDNWTLIISDNFFYERRENLTQEELHLKQVDEEIKKMNMPIPFKQLVAAEKSNYELERLKRVAAVKNLLREDDHTCKIGDYYGVSVFMFRGFSTISDEERNWFHGEDWGMYNFSGCDTEEAINMARSKTVLKDEKPTAAQLQPTAAQLLLLAIRERDKKIEAEEARKRAEEEKELARQKAEEEHVQLENEKNFQEFELIKKFVDEIGDFEVKVPSEEGDGTFTYMPIRQVISFESSCHPPLASYLVKFNYYMNFDCDNSTSFSVKKYGYEEAKKIIIDWAVHYGAREPELTQV